MRRYEIQFSLEQIYVYTPFSVIDVLSIPQTGENFRLLYDVKGRFELVPISAEESAVSLICIKR